MESKLRREIGLLGLTFSGVGLILGAGIYAIIGEAAGLAGTPLWISFLIGAIISSFTGLSYAELSTAIPKAAAEYSYVHDIFESDLASFLVGWTTIITGIVSASTVSLAFGSYLRGFLGTPIIPAAVVLILILSYLNYQGLEESTRVNILFTSIEALGLILIVILGIPTLGSVDYLSLPKGISGVFQASALIFFAYIGFEDIANLAEEAENPDKNLPRAVIISIIVTTLIYILVSISVVSLVDYNRLAESNAPLALAASQALGSTAYTLLSTIALFATANTVLVLLIVNSRMIYGMSRGRELPPILSRISKEGTPSMAILVTTLISLGFVIIGDLGLVAEISNFGTFLTFISVNLSAIWLRYKRKDIEPSFKTPVEIKGIPLIPVIGLFSTGFLLTQLRPIVVVMGLTLLILGLLAKRFLDPTPSS
jgi:APA family basic amino acid/polyamine antiporter